MEATAVVDFAAVRKARRLPPAAFARCIACGHRWVSREEPEYVWLQCPNCAQLYGLYEWPVYAAEGVPHRCGCGCGIYTLTGGRALCVNCGADQGDAWERG
jgi:hypothetical protein